MSWSGTVRCSFCYKEGHNRRGCPTRKSRAAEERAAGQNNYHTRQDDDYRKAAKQRKCSYCSDRGHNASTCPLVKSDWSYLEAADTIWRRRLVDHYKESHPGLGLGAIVLQVGLCWFSTKRLGYFPVKSLYKITQVRRLKVDEVFDDQYSMPSLLRGELISSAPFFLEKTEHSVRTEHSIKEGIVEEAREEVMEELSQAYGKLHILDVAAIPGVHNHHYDFHRRLRVQRVDHPDRLFDLDHGNLQVLSRASDAAVDYMWRPFTTAKYTMSDLSGTPDRGEQRSRLQKVMNSLSDDHNNEADDWSHIYDEIGLPRDRLPFRPR